MPHTMPSFAEQGIKVRTISCFVTLGRDTSRWLAALTPAATFSASLSAEYTALGYEVQSLRLILNPFGEYVDTSSAAAALESVGKLKRVIAELPLPEGIRVRCAIGAARNASELKLVPALVKAYGDLANICLNVPCDSLGIPDVALCDAASEAMLELATTTPRSEGNFNFTVNFNCKPGIPYFPAGYSTKAWAEQGRGECAFSFAIGFQHVRLLTNVLRKMAGGRNSIIEGEDPAKRAAIWAAAAVAMRDASEEHIIPLADIARAAALKTQQDGYQGVPVTFVGVDTSPAPGTGGSKDVAGVDIDVYPSFYKLLGLPYFGAAGCIEASSFLTKCFKAVRISREAQQENSDHEGDLFKDQKNIGFSGLMLAPLEDEGLAEAASKGQYDIRALTVYSAVCGIGLDTVPIPGDSSIAQMSGLMRDTGTMAFRLQKPLTVRLFPLQGLDVGDVPQFGHDDLCDHPVMAVP